MVSGVKAAHQYRRMRLNIILNKPREPFHFDPATRFSILTAMPTYEIHIPGESAPRNVVADNMNTVDDGKTIRLYNRPKGNSTMNEVVALVPTENGAYVTAKQ